MRRTAGPARRLTASELIGDPVPDLPRPYTLDPIRQAATGAINTRSGKPIVDIRCGLTYRGHLCSRHLGGVWQTAYGTVVIVNRLMVGESTRRYQEVAMQPTTREQLWRDGALHAYSEIAPYIHLKGEWHKVPGEEGDDLVRCPRPGHGRWPLGLDSLAEKVNLAIATRSRQQYASRPPT